MKKLIIGSLFLFIMSTASSQQTDSIRPLTKHDYLVKSKSQKIAGFVLLGTGLGLWAIAAPGNVSFSTLGVLVVGGSALVIGSIPLLIASGKNKRRAMKMSADIELQQSPESIGAVFKIATIPSLKVKLNF